MNAGEKHVLELVKPLAGLELLSYDSFGNMRKWFVRRPVAAYSFELLG